MANSENFPVMEFDEAQSTKLFDTITPTEKIVLATAMKSANALPDILVNLNKDDFNSAAHQIIYETIVNLNQANKGVGELDVIDELQKHHQLSKVGSASYILDIASQYYTDRGIENQVKKVYEASQARKFKYNVNQLTTLVNQNSGDVHQALNYVQTNLIDIDLDLKKSDTVQIGKSAHEVIKKLKKFAKSPDFLTGVSTGYSKLDKITNGFQHGDFIILAARPSMGKTALALNLAYNAANAKKQDNRVAIFSVEMPKDQLTQRILATMTGINSEQLRNGKGLNPQDWNKLDLAQDQLDKTKIFIDDTPGITVQQIQSKLFKLKRDENINFVIIDYLQLITTPNSNGNDRQNEISTISRQLKRIARELDVPIVCLSQLSRSVEKREDKRPIMSDLRDSGAIEQDADMIMFLYREDYYKHDKDDLEEEVSPTDLIISKHRNGATGTLNLSFLKKLGKFVDL